jgi:hypothetical protein
MTVQQVDLAAGPSVATIVGGPTLAKPRSKSYLFGPVLDFLGLGGGSVLALIAILLIKPPQEWHAEAATWAMILAIFINNPHFAYSYQIFYGNFREKAFGRSYSPLLRARYIVAGIVVPILLAGFFYACVRGGDDVLLGVAGNAMGFFVGWHYVKQGYGMVIVDSVMKKRFFTAGEKKILLVNAYAVWAASWLSVNASIQDIEFWGLHYYQFAVPAIVVTVGTYFAYACGAVTLGMLGLKAMRGAAPPINGTLAYLVSLYLWLLFVQINPFFLLITPAFHSLQYTVVVWRYRLNKEEGRRNALAAERPELSRGALMRGSLLRHAGFTVLGLALGGLGFWILPSALDALVPYQKDIFGTALFLFMFWIVINVHHYFLDNVMWRRENPDTGKYLFGRT